MISSASFPQLLIVYVVLFYTLSSYYAPLSGVAFDFLAPEEGLLKKLGLNITAIAAFTHTLIPIIESCV